MKEGPFKNEDSRAGCVRIRQNAFVLAAVSRFIAV